MRLSFLRKERGFYTLLESLSLEAQGAVKIFLELIDSWQHSHPSLQTIRDIEHTCDKLVHEIMVKLHKTFITPIDREDIHKLAKRIDDLVDIPHAVTERLELFEINKINPEFKELVGVLAQAVDLVVLAITKLRENKKRTEILDCCLAINRLENQGDRVFERALSRLFHDAKDPFAVIKWKELYDSIEQAIDRCEDIADILWGVVVKYG
jgi:predicted phosphate transport protein (TIGR00153 family)